MLYRQFTETVTIASGVTWGTSKQTFKQKIAQQRRRLEGIILEVKFLTPAGVPTVTSDGFANVFSEVRLKVSDVIGQRNVIQCPSTSLLNFSEGMGGSQGRWNYFGERPAVAAKNYTLHIPVWIRPPAFAEPIGNLFGIPLDILGDDAYLELDLDSNASSASANPSVSIVTIKAVLIYRDVDPAAKYLPTELITNRYTLPATGKQSYNIPQSGFLAALMLDCYSTFPTVRSQLFTAADHELQIDLGSNQIARRWPNVMDFLLDNQNGISPANTPFFSGVAGTDTAGADALYTGRKLGNYLFDFLFDDTEGGAISPSSMLNVNPVPLGGDIAKFTGTNFSAAGNILFTHHKVLTRAPSDLVAMIGA